MVFTTVQRLDSWRLRERLCDYLNLPTGFVREDWPGGPTDAGSPPSSGFVTLARVSTLPQGPARSTFRGQIQRERIVKASLDTWRFSAIGHFDGFDHAFDFAEFASAVLQGEGGQAIFRALRVGMVSCGGTYNLSGLAGAEEERAMFEFVLSVHEIYETTLPAIRFADITVHYEHGREEIHVAPPPDYPDPPDDLDD